MSIRFDYSYAGLSQEELDNKAAQISLADKMLKEKTGAGSDFLGWYDYPVAYDKEEYARIKKAAEKIKDSCDAFIAVSYTHLDVYKRQVWCIGAFGLPNGLKAVAGMW